MKILLILASDIYYKAWGGLAGNSIVNLEPLMLTTLAACIPGELDAEVRIIDEGVEKANYKSLDYDVVGISFCTSASTRAYALCRYWKMKGAFVVAGGPHPTLNPKEAAEYADAVVIGAGEETFGQVLLDFKAGQVQKIYYQDYSRGISSPVPLRDSSRKGYTPIPSVIANRGCPYNCEFCTIRSMWGKGNNKRPIDEVVGEIRSLDSKYIILLDPCPSGDLEYAKELFERLRSLKVWWGCQSTVDIAFNKELLEVMSQSGCLAVFIGFETFCQQNLHDHKKTRNIVEKYAEAVSNFHERGISVIGAFIIGFDHDTKESLGMLPQQIEEIGIDHPRCAILTPYPGTPLYKRFEAEGRLLHKKWHFYDSTHVVFKPANMEPGELQKLYFDIWKGFFHYPKIAKRVLSTKTMPKWLHFAVSIGFRRYIKRLIKHINRPYDPEQLLEKL